MCLLTVHTGKSKMTKEAFNKAFATNPHGVGMAWRDSENKVFFYKNKDRDESYKYYASLSGYNELVLHFRYGTSGENDVRLCHPFRLNSKNGSSLLFHNGVMSTAPIFKGESDTSSLALIINDLNLTDEQIDSIGMEHILKLYASGHNKFVVLNKNGFKIIKEELGKWNPSKDIWYSNEYWNFGVTLIDYKDEELVINNWKNGIQGYDKGADIEETTSGE